MPYPSSIPTELHDPILTRWIAGASPSAILKWIEETNTTRRVPVETSRSSIQRLINTVSQSDAAATRSQAVRRLWMGSTRAMDRLDEISDGYDREFHNADKIKTPQDARQLHARLSIMSRAEASLFRHLRMAGVTGAAAERLVEKYEPTLAVVREKIQAQDAREAEGLPPESDQTRPIRNLVSVTASPEPAPVLASTAPKAANPVETKRAPLPPLVSRIPKTDIPAELIAAAFAHSVPEAPERRAAG